LPYAAGRPRRQRQDKDTTDRRSGSAHLIKTVQKITNTESTSGRDLKLINLDVSFDIASK